MFSPDASIPSVTSLRNPRRRQRATSDDSLAIRQATKRRKRSLLALDTFDPLPDRQQNGHANASVKAPSVNHRKASDASADTSSLVLRGKGIKKDRRGSRSSRRDDGIELTKAENYIVTHDPRIPEALQEALNSEPWQADFFGDLGYAVATTQQQAVIWRYGQKSEASQAFIVKLPHPSKDSSNGQRHLPLAVLVHDSGAGELALLLVVPGSGRVTYWESVSNAAAADAARQRQQGIHGIVSGMLSSEVITKVTEAEPDGFVLSTSTGRLLHLSVKDPQGRPLISTQHLRADNGSNASLLGSLKSVFSSAGWNRDIAAIYAAPSRGRGQRRCVVATSQGVFQVWSLVRNASKTLEFERDVKKQILDYCAQLVPSYDQFALLDFAMLSGERDQDLTAQAVLVLASFTTATSTRYCLLDMVVRDGEPEVNVVYEVRARDGANGPSDASGRQWKPRLLVPPPGHTAFLIFETKIVLVSLTQLDESPNSQLQLESESISQNFEESLPFKPNRAYRMTGCAIETSDPSSEKATCLLMIDGFGLARIAALPADAGETETERRAKLLKSRLEQVVFYGSIADNFLDLRSESRWNDLTVAQLEVAAEQISDSVLGCTSRYIPALSPSMEQQLRARAQALADLNAFVSAYQTSHKSRWYLLGNAEKMAAARAIWQLHSTNIAQAAPGEMLLLPELLNMMSQDVKKENQPELGETDIVRHYLINDVARIEWVIGWTEQAPREMMRRPLYSSRAQHATWVSQANDILIAGLEAAFRYREENAEFYGIGKDMVEDGLYQGKYDMPEPWTSTPLILPRVMQCAGACRATALSNDSDDEDAADFEIVAKIAKDTPRIIHLSCQVFEERCRWLSDQPDEKLQASTKELTEDYHRFRKEMIVSLMDLELPEDAIKLAEKYQDMVALAEVLSTYNAQCVRSLHQPGLDPTEAEEIKARLSLNSQREDSYFDTFGSEWAFALYERHMAIGRTSELLDQKPSHRKYVTDFLRGDPAMVFVSWINEVTVERNYEKAGRDLDKAQEYESNLWSRKAQIALSKLCFLAAKEQQQTDDETVDKIRRSNDLGLTLIAIQERLYNYVRPMLRSAIDEIAEVEILMSTFGAYVKDKPTLATRLKCLFERVVERMALGVPDLLDTISLMTDSPSVVDDAGFADERYFLAFRLVAVMEADGPAAPERSAAHDETILMTKRIVWRRVLLQDDWAAINRTEGKLDEVVARETRGTALWRTLHAGFEDGLFETSPPLAPTDLHPAGETPTSLRRIRYHADKSESFVAAMSKGLAAEDAALEETLAKGRLELWWKGIIEEVKREVREEKDARGRRMAELEEERRGALEDDQARENDEDGDVAMG